MPTLESLIPRFRRPTARLGLETLLDYSKKLPPLPPRLEAEREMRTQSGP